jgi:putative intracellular protease/amidase
MYLYEQLIRSGANVTFLCPSWLPVYKQGDVYLFTEPPTQPLHVAYCSHGLDEAVASSYDVLLTPGGLLSTNGVLRNDGSAPSLLMEVAKQGGLLGFVGTGSALLLPTLPLVKFLASEKLVVPAHPYNVRDLEDAGITTHMPTQAEVAFYAAGSHGQPYSLLFGTGFYDESVAMFFDRLLQALSARRSLVGHSAPSSE